MFTILSLIWGLAGTIARMRDSLVFSTFDSRLLFILISMGAIMDLGLFCVYLAVTS